MPHLSDDHNCHTSYTDMQGSLDRSLRRYRFQACIIHTFL